MNANLAGLFYVLCGLGAALLLIRPSFELFYRGFAVWAVSAILLFGMSGDPLLVLFGTFIAVLIAAPAQSSARVAFFLAVAPSLPVTLIGNLSLPGITTLFGATHYKLAVMALLLPCLFDRNSAQQKFTLADGMLIAYAALTALVFSTFETGTLALRFFVDQLLVIAVPFLAIRRSIRTSKDLELVMSGFVMASVILACGTLFATLKQWDFYRLYEPLGAGNISEFRGGFLRIFMTANAHSLGYHLAAAILMIEALRLRAPFQFNRMIILYPLFLAGIFFTHSRGAVGGLALGLVIMVMVRIPNNALRKLSFAGLFIGGAAAAFQFIQGDVGAIDEYGTFEYRRDLLTTSIDYILAHPYFGDFTFWGQPEFAHLVQGQGIIDITNLYLLILLYYGVPIGVLLFAAIAIPFVSLVRRPASFSGGRAAMPVRETSQRAPRLEPRTTAPHALGRAFAAAQPANMPRSANEPLFQRAIARAPNNLRSVDFTVSSSPMNGRADNDMSGQEELRYRIAARGVLAGCIAGWLFLVVTTSDVGLTMHLGIVLAAIGAAVSRRDFQ